MNRLLSITFIVTFQEKSQILQYSDAIRETRGDKNRNTRNIYKINLWNHSFDIYFRM